MSIIHYKDSEANFIKKLLTPTTGVPYKNDKEMNSIQNNIFKLPNFLEITYLYIDTNRKLFLRQITYLPEYHDESFVFPQTAKKLSKTLAFRACLHFPVYFLLFMGIFHIL